jgi:hypothetical protein
VSLPVSGVTAINGRILVYDLVQGSYVARWLGDETTFEPTGAALAAIKSDQVHHQSKGRGE